MIWRIPREHPIHYVHLYCPECRFDETRREGNWLLLRKGKGFIGLWSSTATEPWNNMNFRCEQRIAGISVRFGKFAFARTAFMNIIASVKKLSRVSVENSAGIFSSRSKKGKLQFILFLMQYIFDI